MAIHNMKDYSQPLKDYSRPLKDCSRPLKDYSRPVKFVTSVQQITGTVVFRGVSSRIFSLQ